MKSVGRSVFLFVLACTPVLAQQITGDIRGTVSDPSGAVIVGATVTAEQIETGLTRVSSTTRDGTFLLLELPVGHYRLEVTGRQRIRGSARPSVDGLDRSKSSGSGQCGNDPVDRDKHGRRGR